MSAIIGVLRVISPEADAGQPPPGHWLPERDLVFPLVDQATSLGRGLHNAIVLFDPTVSREHACLRYSAGSWTVENVSAKSPITVDGVEAPPGSALTIAPGQTVQLGATRLQLVAPDLPPSVQALADDEAGAGHAASMTLARPGLSMRRALGQQLQGWSRLGLGLLIVAFVVMFGVVAVGISTLITERALLGGGATLLAALMLPLIPAAGVVGLIALIDRYEREPWYLLLCAFLWGALIAIPPALYIEDAITNAIGLIPSGALPHFWLDLVHSALFGLNAGITEEAVKDAGLVVLLLIFRHKFENVTDGILYGAIIGAGFAMIENIAYFTAPNLSRHALVFLIIGRVILGWLGHSTFTAIFGAALGYARERRTRPAWRIPLLGFALGALLHSLFDFVAFQANAAVLDAPGSPLVNILALLAVVADYVPLFAAEVALYMLLMRSLAREAGILRAYLVDEVRSGVITPEEYVLLQQASVRQRLERGLLIGRGARFWLAARSFAAALVSLGFVKWQVARHGGGSFVPPESPALLRARIRRLRRAVAQLGGR